MKHLDLFSGIGGFALACEWAGIETIGFCEMDKFCQRVLKNHWPDVEIVEDVNNVEEIRRIVANAQHEGYIRGSSRSDTDRQGMEACEQAGEVSRSAAARCDEILDSNANGDRPQEQGPEQQTGGDRQFIQATTNTEGGQSKEQAEQEGGQDTSRGDSLILTAGFPCQPFSQAGRRKGKDDHRYLWPQTLAVIEAVKPDWCILENVAGLLSMVFPDSETGVASQADLFGGTNDEICDYNTICGGIERDLRQAGYETVWFVIPACSVGAPHRRDRVWIVCHSNRKGLEGTKWNNGQSPESNREDAPNSEGKGRERWGDGSRDSTRNETRLSGCQDSDASNTNTEGLQGKSFNIRREGQKSRDEQPMRQDRGWQEDWYEVATRFCLLDARVSDRVDRLKALGNAIVPQVAYEIIKTIVDTSASSYEQNNTSIL